MLDVNLYSILTIFINTLVWQSVMDFGLNLYSIIQSVETFNFHAGIKCPLAGWIGMELSSHCEYCDFNDEKDLVNMFGGVAYDHDSMPKVVAVHTLSPEKVNNQHSSIIERLPRNIIGIRRNPKKSRDLSIQRSCADVRELRENSVKCVSWSFSFCLFTT